MNEIESENLQKLIEIIKPYSEDWPELEKDQALEKVNDIASYEVDMYELDSYWKSQSVEEFCTQLAVEVFKPGSLNEKQVLEALESIYNEEDVNICNYFLYKYSGAIEFHFKKSSGSLIDALDTEENNTLDKFVAVLRKSDDICL